MTDLMLNVDLSQLVQFHVKLPRFVSPIFLEFLFLALDLAEQFCRFLSLRGFECFHLDVVLLPGICDCLFVCHHLLS